MTAVASLVFSPPDVAGLRYLNSEDAYQFSHWERLERPYPWTPQNFLETLRSPNQKTVVLESNGKAIGFAVFQVVQDEAYLLNIMTDPGFRCQGVGSDLLNRSLKWLKLCQATQVFLDVDPTNIPAIKLYEKWGFRTLLLRTRSYPKGEDAIVMTLDL